MGVFLPLVTIILGIAIAVGIKYYLDLQQQPTSDDVAKGVAAEPTAHTKRLSVSFQSTPVAAPPSSTTTTTTSAFVSPSTNRFTPQINAAIQKVSDAANGKEGWELVKQDSGVDFYKKDYPGSAIPLMKGVGIISAPPLWIVDLISDLNRKSSLDVLFKEGRILESVDEFTKISYLEFKPQWPTSARDFCILSHTRYVYEDGSIIVCYQSTTHPEAPERKGYVRASVIVSGYVIKPINRDGKLHSHVTYVSLADLKGSLPSSLLKMVAMEQPAQLVRIGRVASKQNDFSAFLIPLPGQEAAAKANTATIAVTPAPTPTPAAAATPAPARTSQEKKEEPDFDTPSAPTKIIPIDAGTSATYLAQGEDCVQGLLKAASSNENWESVTTEKDVTIWKYTGKDIVSTINRMKGVGIINMSPAKLFEAIRDPMFRYKYDSMMKRLEVLVDIDSKGICTPHVGSGNASFANSDLSIVYMHHETRKCLVKTARDFVLLNKAKIIDGSKYVLASQSIVYAGVPAAPKIVRGDVLSSGWVIEQVTGDANRSRVTYVTQVDLKGGIPTSVLNLISRKQPLCIAKVRKVLLGEESSSSSSSRSSDSDPKPTPITPRSTTRTVEKPTLNTATSSKNLTVKSPLSPGRVMTSPTGTFIVSATSPSHVQTSAKIGTSMGTLKGGIPIQSPIGVHIADETQVKRFQFEK